MPIEQKVFEIVSETLQIPRNQIRLNDNLVDLVTDSIQLFELLVRFEKELGRKISYDDIADVEKVGDIVAYAHSLGFVTVPV